MEKYGIKFEIGLGNLRYSPEDLENLSPKITREVNKVWINHEGFWYLVKTEDCENIIEVKKKLLKTYNKEMFLEILTSMI